MFWLYITYIPWRGFASISALNDVRPGFFFSTLKAGISAGVSFHTYRCVVQQLCYQSWFRGDRCLLHIKDIGSLQRLLSIFQHAYTVSSQVYYRGVGYCWSVSPQRLALLANSGEMPLTVVHVFTAYLWGSLRFLIYTLFARYAMFLGLLKLRGIC
jgi:hypothetical protein